MATYLDIAQRDLLDAKIMLDAGSYNQAVRLSQQCVEKMLKARLEIVGNSAKDKKLMREHDVTLIAKQCIFHGGISLKPLHSKKLTSRKSYSPSPITPETQPAQPPPPKSAPEPHSAPHYPTYSARYPAA